MESWRYCEVCGNERDAAIKECPFCGTVNQIEITRKGPQQKIINLERGLPTVDEALAHMTRELKFARDERCRVLTLIHGYGSSGRGGKIRREVRFQLEFFRAQGRITDFVTGEEFSSRSSRGRQFLRRFPFLKQHTDLNRANRGITLVAL